MKRSSKIIAEECKPQPAETGTLTKVGQERMYIKGRKVEGDETEMRVYAVLGISKERWRRLQAICPYGPG